MRCDLRDRRIEHAYLVVHPRRHVEERAIGGEVEGSEEIRRIRGVESEPVADDVSRYPLDLGQEQLVIKKRLCEV